MVESSLSLFDKAETSGNKSHFLSPKINEMSVVEESALPSYVDFYRDWEDKPLREIDAFYFFTERPGEALNSFVDVHIIFIEFECLLPVACGLSSKRRVVNGFFFSFPPPHFSPHSRHCMKLSIFRQKYDERIFLTRSPRRYLGNTV